MRETLADYCVRFERQDLLDQWDADGNGDLAYGQGVTVADDRRGQARSINFQHRDVGGGILTDDGGVVALIAAVQLHLYAGRAADDVGAGQDVAVLADDDAGTGTKSVV